MMVQGFPPQFSHPDSLSGDKFTLVTEKVAADQALTGQVSAKTVTPAAPSPLPGAGLRQLYLGVGQVSEGPAGLQGLQELHDGGDATLGQQHSAQAAELAEDLLQLRCHGARRQVLRQDHGLASLRGSLWEEMNARGTAGQRVPGPRHQTRSAVDS